MKKFILPIILIVIGLFIVISCVANDNDDTKVESADPKTTSEVSQTNKNKSTIVHVGEKLTAGGLEITFVSVNDYESENQFIQPKAGNKYIRLLFECKNVGESDQFINEYDFKCYADDAACDTIYLLDESLSGTISAGRTTTGSVFFEIPENAEHVEVEYALGFLTNEKAIFLVK